MSSPPGSLLSFITTVGWAMKKGGRFGSRTGSYFLFPWIRTVVLLDQVAQKILKISTALYSIICLIRHKTRQKSNKLNRYLRYFFYPLERCPGYPVGLISDLFYRYTVYGRKPDMASRPAEYLVVKIAENPTKYAARPF